MGHGDLRAAGGSASNIIMTSEMRWILVQWEELKKRLVRFFFFFGGTRMAPYYHSRAKGESNHININLTNCF